MSYIEDFESVRFRVTIIELERRLEAWASEFEIADPDQKDLLIPDLEALHKEIQVSRAGLQRIDSPTVEFMLLPALTEADLHLENGLDEDVSVSILSGVSGARFSLGYYLSETKT